MKFDVKYFIFILFEGILILIIIILGFKLLRLWHRNIKGIQISTAINKENVSFNPTSSLKYFYEPKSNKILNDSANWLGYEVKYSINSDSLNDLSEYSVEKESNTYRIMTIGDSFTFGMYVDTAQNYPKILEKLLKLHLSCRILRKNEVLNLGVYGYDLEYVGERFKLRGLKYKPDIVFWLVNDNNFDKINELLIPLDEQLRKEGTETFNPSKGEYTSAKKAQEKIINDYGLEYIIHYQENALFKFKNYPFEKLVILNFPGLKKEYKKIIQDFIQLDERRFSVYELFNYKKEYQLLDHHPNVKGHEMIAKEIYNYLLTNTLKDECKSIN